MKIVENNKGQFIIIAVMIIAIMMISLSVTMYSASTYYKFERWEEYMTLIDHVKLNTIRAVELSLANYTNNPSDISILTENLMKWQVDLRKAYPGYGVVLTYELSNAVYQVSGTNINYSQGLGKSWNQPTSVSAASAKFTLSFESIGLEGYVFEAVPSLSLKILNVNSSGIFLTVRGEDNVPVTGLTKENFNVAGVDISSVASFYNPDEALIYRILCTVNVSSPITVTVTGQRGIKVTAMG